MRKKKRLAPDWFLGFNGIMLGPKINMIEVMIKIGSLKQLQLQAINQKLKQPLWPNGLQFSMSLQKAHHQIIPRNHS